MDIKQIKQARPEWSTLSDSQVVDMVHQLDYPDLPKEQVARALGVALEAPKQPPMPGRGVAGWARDLGISALKGAIAVPEAAVGLADIATGGQAGKKLEELGYRPAEARAILDDLQTDQAKQASAAVQNADGVMGTLGAVIDNPSVIPQAIVESAPLMGGGGGVARGLMKVAPKMGVLGAAAAGEGIVSAGSSAEQIRQQTADGLLTGEQAGIAATIGALTGSLGALGGKIAKKLGIGDVDTMIAQGSLDAGVRKGVVRSTLEGAVSEGILEELPQSVQEQALQNLALGKPIDEGVDQAAVLGALTGAAMGAGAAAVARPRLPNNGPLSRGANLALDQIQRETQAARPGAQGLSPDQEAQAMSNIMAQGDADMQAIKQAGIRDNGPSLYPDAARSIPGMSGLDPLSQSAEPFDSLGDRIMTTRQTLDDEGNRDAIRSKFGQSALDEVLYYLNQADRPGQIPDQTRENMLAVAEEIISRSRLSPVEPTPSVGAGGFSPMARLGAGVDVPQIGLDTTPTGVMRADAQGNVAPETAADAIQTRQAQAEAKTRKQGGNGMEGQTPRDTMRGAGPGVMVGEGTLTTPERPTRQQPDAGPVPRLVYRPNGEPFKNQRAAVLEQRRVGGDVVPVEGGWAVQTQSEAVNEQDQAATAAPTAPQAPQEAAGQPTASNPLVDRLLGKMNAVARQWDTENRSIRNDEWQAGAAISNRAFDAVGDDGSHVSAHGMAKSPTLGAAIKSLTGLLNGGIDPSRTLYYDALTSPRGATTGATAGGHAYRDGPFIITFREGLNGRQPTSADITGVLVNPAHAEIAGLLQKMYPSLVVRDYSGVADVVSASRNQKNEQAPQSPTQAQPKAADARGAGQAGSGEQGGGVPGAGGRADAQADGVKKTPDFLKTKTVPEMTDEELKEAQAFYGPKHKRAKTIEKEMGKRAPKAPAVAEPKPSAQAPLDEGKARKDDQEPVKARQAGEVVGEATEVSEPEALPAPETNEGAQDGQQVQGQAPAEKLSLSPLEAMTGKRIDADWVAFSEASDTLGIPRAEMPQIKDEHRGAMVNFLNARGIEHEQDEVAAASLKPTQAEFSPAKVAQAKAYEGGDRSILVSEDGRVVDGHHQWLAKLDAGDPVKVIQLMAPVREVLDQIKEFPSADQDQASAQDAEQQDDAQASQPEPEAKATEPQETPQVSEAEARKRLTWRDLGQSGGEKTWGLYYDDGEGRGMRYGTVSKLAGSRWSVDGHDGGKYEGLQPAKNKAKDMAVERLRRDGYVTAAPVDGIGWDGMSEDQRTKILSAAGWTTAAGGLNFVGKRLLNTAWSDISEGTRGTIERFASAQEQDQQAATGGVAGATAGGSRSEPAVKQAKPSSRIEDVGEKIGGARKDVWTSFKDDLNAVADGDLTNQPLSKIWPAPDYQKLIDDGMDAGAVALVRSFRDEIPAKPRATWKVKRWAEQVKTLREFANDLLSGSSTADQFRQSARNLSAISNGLLGRADLYLEVGHGKSLEGIRLVEHHYTLYRGRENVKLWAVEREAAATAFSNWPQEIATGDTKQQAIDGFKAKYATLDAEKQVKKASFDVISMQGKFFVAKKVGRNYAKLAGPFATVKEARDHRLNNLADLEKALEAYKEIPKERRDVNAPRVGEDMRNGQDVTPDFFAKTFGFRGVEFGNWVEQSRRQKDLNDAFDALMDMAAVLGLPPKALSLNGELGLAFGARGGGGVGAAAAHYEHSKVVINLTKKEGAGSLGHEWWHAVDNYFSRMRKQPGDMMTTALDVSLASRGSNFVVRDGVRREMVQAFGQVVSAIKRTAMKARSERLDGKRSKEYWTTGEEMSARAFESYLIAKLQDQQASNDYLANVVDQRTWDAMAALGVENDNSYPYPTADEIPAIREGFDQFFQAVQTRENDAGNVVMFSRQGDADGQNTAEQNALKALSENDDLFRLPKSDGMTVEDITADNDPGIKVKKLQGIPGRTEYQFTMPNGKTARMVVRPANPYGANTYGFDYVDGEASNVLDVRPGDNPEDVDADKEDVWIDVSLLSSGQDGARIYNIASTYAHNTGRIFIGDPAGLSDDALIRRPEQMLSSALKFGTTEHLAPHPRQITGDDRLGVPSLQWVYGDHIGNIKRLIDVNLKVAENAGLDEITFDPTDGSFRDSEGGDLGREGIQALAMGAGYGRAAGAGPDTLARGAVLRALLREEGGAGEGEVGGRDGLLARLVSVSATHDEATKRVFYSREGVDQPETGEGFRRQDAIAAIAHMDMVEDLVRQLTDGWKNAPEIVVLRSMEEAPEAVRRENDRQLANGATGEPEAFYHQGKAYLLASHMRSMNDVRRAVFHEVLGHLGMRGLYGTEIGEILDQVARARRADVEAKAKQYGLNMKNARDRQIAAEEWLAEIAQDNPQLGFVRRAVAAIRSWLRRNVPALAKMRMTDDEIVRELIAPVQRFIKDGPPDGGMGLIPAFRRDGGFSRAEEAGFSRTQAAQEFTGKAREAMQDFFGSAGAQVDFLDRTFKTQYAKAQKFPQFGSVFSKVQDYIEGISTLANQAADNAPSILPKLEGWRDLAKTGLKPEDAKAVAAPIFEGTLSWARVDGELVPIDEARADGFEGEAGVVFTKSELRDRFGLTDGQVASYYEFRSAVNESLDQLVSSEVIRLLGDVPPGIKALAMSKDGRARLRQAIADSFENQEDPLLLQINDKFDHVDRMKARGYAPLSRFGQYWVHVVGKDGETLYFGLEESSYRANRLARTLRDEFAGASVQQGKMSQEFHKLMSAVPLDAMELFASAIGADQSEVFQKYIQLAKNNRSTMKRLMKRKGTSGFSEDVPRVLASFVTSNARAASTALNIKDAKDLASDIPQGDIKDEAIKMVEAVTEPEESGAAIRGVMFANFIGGSIASAVVNVTQPFMMTLPYLSQWGGAIKAGARLVSAARMMAAGVDEASDIGKALKRAENEGIVSPQEIHHLIARAAGGIGGRNLYLQKLALLWGGPFSVAEQFNRQVSFLAAYQTAQAEGMADPFGFAEKTVVETQGLYNSGNKPNVSRGVLGATTMCVDEATEALTSQGWKTIDQVRPGDLFASLDMNTGRLLWKPAARIYRSEHSEREMIHVRSESLDMLMTPDHRCVTYRRRRKPGGRAQGESVYILEIQEAQNLSSRDNIPSCAEFDHEPSGDPVRDAIVPVLGWVITEGCYYPEGYICIYQNENRFADAIRSDLKAAGIDWTETSQQFAKGNGLHTRFFISKRRAQEIRNLLPDKHLNPELLMRLSVEQIRLLVDRMIDGDGSVQKGGKPGYADQRTFIQNPGQTLESFQMALTMLGLSYSVRKHNAECRKVIIRTSQKHNIGRATKERVRYEGRVWCPMIPETNTWVARRNGMPFITHNTFKQYSIHYLEWLARMAKSGPEGKKAAVLALALLVMAAGSDGLPFMDDLDDVFDTVGQAMGYDTNTKRSRREMVASVLGDELAEVATRGFSAAGGFPVDLSIRMGMGNLLPATDILLKSNTDTARSLAEIAGPGGAMFTQFRDAARALLSGDIGGAVQKASPVALQNLAKAAKMAETGEYRDQRDRKVTDVDATDVGMKALSFQPARIARESTRMSEARQSEMLAKTVEGEITDKWARAIADGDKEAEKEALKMRDDWNEKNPDQPIVVKRSQAVRKARNMKMDRRDRFIKSVAPERRALVDKEVS